MPTLPAHSYDDPCRWKAPETMHELLLSAYYPVVFLLVALATEAIIEIVKESDISLALIHSKIVPRYTENPTWYNWTLYKWITCGQCMSVIYSIPGAMILSYIGGFWWFPIIWFALQRITNWLNTSYKLLHRGRVTAIELVSPLVSFGNEMNEYNPEALLSQAREREFRRGSEERVIINGLPDIKRIIKQLKDRKPGSGKVVSLDVGAQKFHINTSTDHPPYMEIIKDAILGADQEEAPPSAIPINEGETIIPLRIGANSAVNSFIRKCTGGERDGDRIKWVVNDDIYYYDPVQDRLTMADNG